MAWETPLPPFVGFLFDEEFAGSLIEDSALVRTSKVRLDSQRTSTVNTIAFAPSLSTFRMRSAEIARSLLR